MGDQEGEMKMVTNLHELEYFLLSLVNAGCSLIFRLMLLVLLVAVFLPARLLLMVKYYATAVIYQTAVGIANRLIT